MRPPAQHFPDVAERYPMTEAEFDAWMDEDAKAEWADDITTLYPSASLRHCDVMGWLSTLISLWSERHQAGQLFISNVIVRFPRSRRSPDLQFIATERRNIIKPTYIDGAPDLIIEIVSPDSVERDWRDKYLEYEANGVREYWVIDLRNEQMRAYQRGDDGHYTAIEEKDGKVASGVLPGFWIRPTDVWQESLPSTVGILQELGVLA